MQKTSALKRNSHKWSKWFVYQFKICSFSDNSQNYDLEETKKSQSFIFHHLRMFSTLACFVLPFFCSKAYKMFQLCAMFSLLRTQHTTIWMKAQSKTQPPSFCFGCGQHFSKKSEFDMFSIFRLYGEATKLFIQRDKLSSTHHEPEVVTV